MNVLLVSTYDLGRQPFGLASPAAWLRREGARVATLDLAVEAFDAARVEGADLVAFHVPMHTATRLAAGVVPRVRELAPRAHLCFYGLYAAMNEGYLRSLGAGTVLGGEFEEGLAALVRRLAAPAPGGAGTGPQPEPVLSLARQSFAVPDRAGLPPLDRYARLELPGGEARAVAYTEASRGCRHLCRHCPVVPVYGGRFRIVAREVVLEDVGRQVEAGAEHVTFGDPDFLNGPGHALPLVRELHERWPHLTYDVTVKVEHLLRHARLLPGLRETGCLFVTSAVESIDDDVLRRYDKGHTRADFLAAVALMREVGLAISPTFVTFSPWTTLGGYLELLDLIEELGLVENVAPVQYAIRLLIPAGSRLLELEEVRGLAGELDPEALLHPWRHPEPGVDALHDAVREQVSDPAADADRARTFARVRELALEAAGRTPLVLAAAASDSAPQRAAVPRLNEPWYC